MCRWAIIFLALISATSGQAQRAGTELASLRFSLGNGAGCRAAVRDLSSPVPRRQLTITCEGRLVLSYTTDDDLVDISRDSAAGDRIIARWEGGSHFRMTVFQIGVANLSITGQKVFDESLDFAPDFLVAPDDLLVYRNKRFIGSEIIPSRTDVYHWTGDHYVLAGSWKWNEDMRYEDRFCVLDPQKLSCPATSVPIR